MTDINLNFDLPKDQSNIIKVIGVGGGGSNAVNHMYEQGIKDVDFIVCNTDKQALENSPVPVKIQLGTSLTEGLGAGCVADVGRNAAIESIDELRDVLNKNTKMVFVTAGMGGGTGTGAAPVIAEAARELGILTVGIVTVPFRFEGKKKRNQAEEGLELLRNNVDALIIINNDKIKLIYSNLTLSNAFGKADDVLTVAAKGIAETITGKGYVNVDFNDVKTVMTNGGVAVMGTGVAEGDNRALDSITNALSSPLLNDNDISGARHVLLNITYGDLEVQMDEIADITDFLEEAAGDEAEVIWGSGYDETLGESLSVTLVATGFESKEAFTIEPKAVEVKKHVLPETEKPVEITRPVNEVTPVEEDLVPTLKTVQPEEPKAEVKVETPSFEEPQVEMNLFEPEVKIEAPSEEVSNNWDDIQVKQTETPVSETPSEPVINFVSEDTTETPINFVNEEETPSTESEKVKFDINDEYEAKNVSDAELRVSKDDLDRTFQERLDRIKKNTEVLKSPSGIKDLENVPAYERRKVQLDEIPHSSENTQSRFTVGEKDKEGRSGLRSNNSFLHDNVD